MLDIIKTIIDLIKSIEVVKSIWTFFAGNKRLQDVASVGLRSNLPRQPYIGKFYDREQETKEICDLLLGNNPDKNTFPVIGIQGIGGVGKTTLAWHIGNYFAENYKHLDKEQRFEAIIWVTAKTNILTENAIIETESPARTLSDIYRKIAITMERPDILTVEFDEQSELIRQILKKQRTLIILDNLDTIQERAIIAFYLNLPRTTMTIVTSRNFVEGAYPVKLNGLPREYSTIFTKKICEHKKVNLSDKQIESLTEKTNGIPLAIVWSIGQMQNDKDFELVLRRLEEPTEKIAQFCFESSVSDIRGTDAHKILMALSLFTPDADRRALQYVANIDRDELVMGTAISSLIRLSLVEENNGRIQMLPLTKNFAYNELVTCGDFFTYKKRFQEYMMELVSEKVGIKNYWDPITHWLESKGLDADIDNLLQCVKWASSDGQYNFVLYVGGALVHHLWRSGRVLERIDVCDKAVYAARQLGEFEWEVWLLIDGLGYIFITQGDWEDAKNKISEGNSAAERHEFLDGQALASTWLGYLSILQDRYDEAKLYLEKAEKLAQTSKVKGRLRFVEGYLALVHQDYSLAEEKFKDAVKYRKDSDKYEPPSMLAYLGVTQALQNKMLDARETLERVSERPTVEGAAYARFGLAIIEAASGKLDNAENLAHQSLETISRIGSEFQKKQIEEFIENVEKKKKQKKNILAPIRSKK